ncbi:phosphonate degradation HD-domain oxygenase [Algoriphagus machipongonensis]|uniref:Phosphonate degradation operons associated HDIG domain protein n=1 Tax=Algoriphagus machipongonensis TaxID=388413 RepID=A3I180_9BACT|nr:phosphonate degradation HD-domain oxygenase [Algoriphagus machipongonensis]EAZ80226.1 phosphonate degradation operons associated HDIG domain protein [Algoriphagus machipongonensis]
MKPTFIEKSKNKRLALIFDLYEKYGDDDYIGEPVSQIEHMCQSAQLAEKEGYDEEVILAAFFHDIGHLCVHLGSFESMNGYGIKSHEKIGGDFLRDMGFPERIAKLVENHVQAKRYLTFKNPAYFDKLSEASRKTLEFQGGKMNESEAKEFENDPLFEVSIKMRNWDELAKLENVPLPDLGVYRKIAERLIA